MENRLPPKFVQTAFAAAILSLLSEAAGAQAPSWSLTLGTNPANNFLGITDGQPLVIQPRRPGVGSNVGIGTTNPEARLHIHSPDDDALKVTNTAVGKTLGLGVDKLGSWLEPLEHNSSIRLNASPSLVGLLIDGQTGNVGIGTTGPLAKLVLDRGFNERRETLSLLIRHNGDSPISPAFILQNDQGGEINQVFLFGPNSDPGGLGPSHEAGGIIANWHGLTINSGKGVTVDGSSLDVKGTSDRRPGISGSGPNVGIYAHNSASGHDAYLASGCCAGDFNGDVYVHGKTTTQVLEITGGSDLAEPFTIDSEGPIQPGMVVAIDLPCTPASSGWLITLTIALWLASSAAPTASSPV